MEFREKQNTVDTLFKTLDNLNRLDDLSYKIDDLVNLYLEEMELCEKKIVQFLDLISMGQDKFEGGVKNYKDEVNRCFDDVLRKRSNLEFALNHLEETVVNQTLFPKLTEVKDGANYLIDNVPTLKMVLNPKKIVKGDNDLSKIEINEDYQTILVKFNDMLNDLRMKSEPVFAKCDLCREIYARKIGAIYYGKLEYYANLAKENEVICKIYHETFEQTLQQKLAECDGSFIKYQTETNAFMKEYNNAYDTMRKNANEVFDIVKEMKTILTTQTREEKEANKSKGKSKKVVDPEIAQEIAHIEKYQQSTQKSLDAVRKNLRQDTVKHNTKMDNLKNVLLQR